jgi:hypothetical protein
MTINSDVTIDESSEDGRDSGMEPASEREPETPPEDLEILQALRETESEHEEARRSSGLFRKGGIDKVVFGVAGLLTLAFVIWGFAGRENLAATSQVVLDWVMKNTGWLFVGLSSLFVGLRPVAGGQPLRKHSAGERRGKARVLHGLVGLDDVRRRAWASA